MKIRLLQKGDILACGEIVRKNYNTGDQKSVTAEMKDMFIKGPIRPKYFVVEDGGKVIGFAGYMQSWIDYAIYQIFWVNVTPKKQGQGIGESLVKKIISEIKKDKKAKLITLSATNPEFYMKHFKFKKVDSFKGNHHTHYLMSLSVK